MCRPPILSLVFCLLVPALLTATASAEESLVPVTVAEEIADECPPAQPCLQADGTITLDTITLSASRRQEAPIDTLGGVSVVRPSDPTEQGARRTVDMLRNVPGVAVAADGTDQSTVINIRGLQDSGRVAVIIDGARQNFSQNGHGTTGVFLPDPFLIGKATVVRGPIANVYGSGAIGGVVTLDTIAPADLIGPEQTWMAETLLSYATNGDGRKAGARGARQLSDQVAVLGALYYTGNATFDDGDGFPIIGSPMDGVTGLLKTVVTPDDFNTVTASYLHDHTSYTRDASTDFNKSAYDTDVILQTAALKWEYANPDDSLLDFDVSGYWTGTDKTETYLYGANAGKGRTYDIGTFGFDAVNTSTFETGAFAHALSIGADTFADDVDTRDVEGGTGAVTTPSGDRTVYGAFIQDEVNYSTWLSVTGSLRLDGYDFSGEDADGEPVTNSGTRVSPKVVVGISPFETTDFHGLEFYGSYAEGYRAPTITETLVSGDHPGFTFIPNPNLKPETAHNIEFGLNLSRDSLFTAGDALRVKAGWFHNQVDDYIDGRVSFDPVLGMTYQYQNVKSALLEGVELEATYDLGTMFAGVSASRIRGTDESTDGPLGSVPPDKVVTTLGFRMLENRLTIGGQWEAVAAQTLVPEGTLESEAFNLIDLFATYAVNENVDLGLNINNLFDVQYVEYLNDDPSPGMSVMFTLNARLGG